MKMGIPELRTKDLLTVTDLNQEEIINIFKFTSELKDDLKNKRDHKYLKDKVLAMIFEKSSTRTRISFQAGIFQLGGEGLFLSGNDIQIGRGETISDTAKVMSRYVDGIMIRTFSHDTVIELAENAGVSVINGLTDTYHPCQSLTDYFTIYEREETFSGIKFVYVGDGNNMTHSLLLTSAILGADISVASPEKYSPEMEIVNKAKKIAEKSGSKIVVTKNIMEAVENADYIYTDVWTSMGQEEETKLRMKALSEYKISKKILDVCSKDCKIMHCLPAHRGEEIDEGIIESENSIIFDQAENRLHLQKALMVALMK
jgi:ornithine carbamoyltransferase